MIFDARKIESVRRMVPALCNLLLKYAGSVVFANDAPSAPFHFRRYKLL